MPRPPKKVAAKKTATEKPTAKKSVKKTTKKTAPKKTSSAPVRGRPTLPVIDRESQVAKLLAKLQKSEGLESPADIAAKFDLRLTQARKLVDSAYHGTPVALLEHIADTLGKRLVISIK